MLSSQLIPKAKPSIVWTKLPDGAVLFSTETEEYYSVNAVGALIWELLPQEGLDMRGLCNAVADQFPGATREQIEMDASELLSDLARNGLVA